MRVSFMSKIVVFASCLLLIACSSDDKAAQQRLDKARELFRQGDYTLAKQEIDSMKTLYPKAFDRIKESFVLVDSIRYAENTEMIAACDSLMAAYMPVIDSMKQYFIYQRNKEYQETGFFIPKEGYTGDKLSYTTLRSGVDEKDGKIYIESVFIGNQIHNQIKVSTKDGSFAESLPVTDEGFNFRFSELGKQFEVIKFAGKNDNDNGVAQFVYANEDKPITVTLSGGSKNTYTLPQNSKKAIVKALDLSVMMTQMDSLKTEKEKALYKLQYLKDKVNGGPTEVTE